VFFKLVEKIERSWLAFWLLVVASVYALALSFNYFWNVEGTIMTHDGTKYQGTITQHGFNHYKVESNGVTYILLKDNVKIAFFGEDSH